MCAAELRLRTGTDRPVRARRVASADDSLTMITCGRGLETAEGLRFTDACRSVIGPRDVDMQLTGWCSSAARCCSLQSQLRSRGGSPAPYVMTDAGMTPRSARPVRPPSGSWIPSPIASPSATRADTPIRLSILAVTGRSDAR